MSFGFSLFVVTFIIELLFIFVERTFGMLIWVFVVVPRFIKLFSTELFTVYSHYIFF